ncbi:hypothetical protein Nepgr_006089 [Nepenthes gracilis]|uniref:protein-serine/threonine phosphatase n=1 Tax=Nepenthes gracilis TaxID=150966 RepID=A0AAD3S4W5_NEPGR|nr:hypothetical protein Nepgr_006089 [Nepenthes gracilis]
MAGMCCGIVGESEPSPVDSASRTARRGQMEVRQLKTIADVDLLAPEKALKRQKIEVRLTSPARECENPIFNCSVLETRQNGELEGIKSAPSIQSRVLFPSAMDLRDSALERPKFGLMSVRGRRRDMEDAVSIRPYFCGTDDKNSHGFHFYGVFDGHGCSHVAFKCKDRMHKIIKEDLERDGGSTEWKEAMERSFLRMDKEAVETSNNQVSPCRCELQTPQCDAVGSTAVVAIVTPDRIVVSNCGDSRAVLCRNGVPIPLSSDHKPDRPDELHRIQAAGGRIIYWDGPRVLGVLAMSRAIGDNYLKPYVIPEPEVTVTERTAEDEFLILATDGLWDVVSNETASGVVRMCLSAVRPRPTPRLPGVEASVSTSGESSDLACTDASILLTRLALGRRSADNISVVVVDLRRDL